jgi:glycosyltransferase involved in cell wall biosynthesis
MRIAQVAPLYESVPPRGYGGTERVVSYLTEELVRRGHQVTLFASGDSRTAGHLVACSRSALRLASDLGDPLAYHVCQIDQVFDQAERFDIIHMHVDHLGFPMARRCPTPTVTTLHGRLDLPELQMVFRRFADAPVVSISDAQRAPLPFANWQGTVHHGMPAGELTPGGQPRGYLAFLGRISPEKGADRAIEIARRADLPLKIAAKVDRVDRDYYQQVVHPMIDPAFVEYVGEIGHADKQEFLRGAMALLFPIDWPEPFGLVMIEAMACGTPVVAFRRGSVPEVMREGMSGFVVDDMDGAVRALRDINSFDRAACRAYFERRFTVQAMTDGYLSVYRQLLAAAAERAAS